MNTPATAIATQREETSKVVTTLTSDVYQQKFKNMLPPDVNLERFTAVVVRAVQENPKLLEPATNKTSLFLACQKAAQDGLLPDKREGALVMYGNEVQWQPMIGGLRKRLAGAGFDLRAEVIHENDDFDYSLGDEPYLHHKPAKLGQPRGKVIGAYAVATHTASGTKYREVMDVAQLDAVQKVSKGGGPWTGPFKTEMQRKTVGRRLIKSLPIDDRRLADLLERDNENFDVANPEQVRAPTETAARAQAAARGAAAGSAPASRQDEAVDAEFVETTTPETGGGDPRGDDEAEF